VCRHPGASVDHVMQLVTPGAPVHGRGAEGTIFQIHHTDGESGVEGMLQSDPKRAWS
jgi:hypothetical protein